MKAGVFDSGVGGLTVVKSLLKRTLFDEIIYYGDTARVPYGSKDQNTIIRYSLETLEFFNNFDPDILIVACNTASAYALNELKNKAKFPVVGVIEPGVLALQNSNIKKNDPVLVIGTNATINSKTYQKLLFDLGFSNITATPTPLLAPLVEEGILYGEIVDAVFRRYFANLGDFSAVIMGCTHYPLMQNSLAKWFKNAKLLHSGEAIVEYLINNNLVKSRSAATKITYFASENVARLKEVAERWIAI
ncbi:MAG: glutamate racemase [Helicobacteraceae bacterium]|jgi:glutamate racemase|nr:glutamate racemase [Helicobacteraceae bacterium]